MMEGIDRALKDEPPKHPPEGAICDVWDDEDDECQYLERSNGNGKFGNCGWDHFRVIVTAKDALGVLVIEQEEHRLEGFSHVLPGIEVARKTIQRLIDDAMEG